MTDRIVLGDGLTCDLDILIETRLLINAASGGGKSRTLRRLAEQTHGKVQQIILDPEGEFPSLREKFDYVVAAKHGGDAVADPRSAALLATKLLELRVSAVVDLFELNKVERRQFVKLFFEAMLAAPKSLWHPVLVMLDEAHIFAPEGDEAVSATAVEELASQGRKRGFCLIVATQRLSKLSKDVAAEMRNVMIGNTVLDVDMKRAADVLGFDKVRRTTLRDLTAGQFWTFGPALVKVPTLFTMGPIQTTHPKVGDKKVLPAPPPTAKIKALLPQLADLPQEAEQKARTEAELRKELSTARAAITRLEKGQDVRTVEKAVEKRVEVPVLKDGQLARAEKLLERYKSLATVSESIVRPLVACAKEIADAIALTKLVAPKFSLPAHIVVHPKLRPAPMARPVASNGHGDASDIVPAQQKILNGIAFLQGIGVTPADKTQLALIVGVSPTSGGYFNNLGRLRTMGMIDYPSGGTVALTTTGEAHASTDGVPTTTGELHDAIRGKLPAAKWKIVEWLIGAYPDSMAKDELAIRIGVSPTSGGYFNNLGSLRSLGLIDYPAGGHVVALPVLFLDR